MDMSVAIPEGLTNCSGELGQGKAVHEPLREEVRTHPPLLDSLKPIAC